ncbi:hypothetical protein HK099_004334 [Clydaea vesicula]|uniref:Uncharacterized protein n=1 Tax=Clydaea vesicula TaxID=447962 RepID=A0AAD5U716_9FUNG|nr:hypothetical protein HK099_004334 [Clydaea vesicula]
MLTNLRSSTNAKSNAEINDFEVDVNQYPSNESLNGFEGGEHFGSESNEIINFDQQEIPSAHFGMNIDNINNNIECKNPTSNLNLKKKKKDIQLKKIFEHRQFNALPTKPVSNKLLALKWENRVKEIHKKHLKIVGPTIDNSAPPVFPHLESREKKMQKEFERLSIIQRNNEILLKRIAFQMTTPNEHSYSVNVYRDNCIAGEILKHSPKNNNQKEKIEAQNLAFYQRLEERSPNYNRNDWERNRRSNLAYLVNISKYPENYICTLRKKGFDPIANRIFHRPVSAPSPKTSLMKLEEERKNLLQQKAALRPKTAPPLRKSVVSKSNSSSRPQSACSGPPRPQRPRPKTAFRRANATGPITLSDTGSVIGSFEDRQDFASLDDTQTFRRSSLVKAGSTGSIKSVRFLEDDTSEYPLSNKDIEKDLINKRAGSDPLNIYQEPEVVPEESNLGFVTGQFEEMINSYIVDYRPEMSLTSLQERKLSELAFEIVQNVLSETVLELSPQSAMSTSLISIANDSKVDREVKDLAWDIANKVLNSSQGSEVFLSGLDENEIKAIENLSSATEVKINSRPASSRNSIKKSLKPNSRPNSGNTSRASLSLKSSKAASPHTSAKSSRATSHQRLSQNLKSADSKVFSKKNSAIEARGSRDNIELANSQKDTEVLPNIGDYTLEQVEAACTLQKQFKGFLNKKNNRNKIEDANIIKDKVSNYNFENNQQLNFEPDNINNEEPLKHIISNEICNDSGSDAKETEQKSVFESSAAELKTAATTLQANWRGYLSRKRLSLAKATSPANSNDLDKMLERKSTKNSIHSLASSISSKAISKFSSKSNSNVNSRRRSKVKLFETNTEHLNKVSNEISLQNASINKEEIENKDKLGSKVTSKANSKKNLIEIGNGDEEKDMNRRSRDSLTNFNEKRKSVANLVNSIDNHADENNFELKKIVSELNKTNSIRNSTLSLVERKGSERSLNKTEDNASIEPHKKEEIVKAERPECEKVDQSTFYYEKESRKKEKSQNSFMSKARSTSSIKSLSKKLSKNNINCIDNANIDNTNLDNINNTSKIVTDSDGDKEKTSRRSVGDGGKEVNAGENEEYVKTTSRRSILSNLSRALSKSGSKSSSRRSLSKMQLDQQDPDVENGDEVETKKEAKEAFDKEVGELVKLPSKTSSRMLL